MIQRPIDIIYDSKERFHTIISPYLSLYAFKEFLTPPLCSTILSYRRLITLFSPNLFIEGSSDIRAIQLAHANGFTVYSCPRLHAKLYIGASTAYAGSANCTLRGLGLATIFQANIETLFKVDHTWAAEFGAELVNMSDVVTEDMLSETVQHTETGRVSQRLSTDSRSLSLLQDLWLPAVFNTRLYFAAYNGDLQNIPSTLYSLLRADLELLSLPNTHGSFSAFERALVDRLSEQYAFDVLVRSFEYLKRDELVERLVSHDISESSIEHLVSWINWASSVSSRWK